MRSWGWMWAQAKMGPSGLASCALPCGAGTERSGVGHLGRAPGAQRRHSHRLRWSASWQRCRTHFMTNLLTRVPKRTQMWVATMVRSIYQQPSAQEVHIQHDKVVEQLAERFPQAAAMLDEAGVDILAFTHFPMEHWKKIWSNNPQERLNKEIRRRTDVVGIFPNRSAAMRLVGAVLAEQNDEWIVGRRYLTPAALTNSEALPEVQLSQPTAA